MGTVKTLVSETLHLISEFIREVEGTALVTGHSLTYQLGDDDTNANISTYLLSLEKLISNLKIVVHNLKSKAALQSAISTHQSEVLSDNESSEESQGISGEGSDIPGSQMSNTTQYGLPADIKALDKHPALDSMVDDANSTVGLVLPPSSITSIPSSNALPETLLASSFPATFSSAKQQQPQMRSLTESTLILDASVTVDQSYSNPPGNQEDVAQYPKCIKCGAGLSPENEATLSGASGLVDTCSQCSSIADSVSKRRRRKNTLDDTTGLDPSVGDDKAHESTPKKHSCEKCGRVFSKWKHLSIHCTKVHMDEDGGEGGNTELISNNNTLPIYCCKTCNMACLSMNSFNTHTCRLPTDDENTSSLSNRILITNVLKLHKLRKFVCEMCGVEYRTFKRITYHLPRCSPGPYPCNVCTLLFATQKELNYHKRKMHKDEKCFVCEECGKSFQRRTSLQKHAINWHESSSALGPFKCDLCPKKFIRRIYLTNHKLRMHGLDKKFLCQVCGNKFMTQNSLMTHMEVHSDQKRFECSFCKKKFKRKEKLKYHERIHTGERPFQCQLCARGFVSKTKLDEHVSRHRGDRRYRCSFCTKTYAGAYDLKQHIRRVHDKECDKVAVTVIVPSQPSTESNSLTQVQVLDPLAIATAASGLKEEEVVTCGSSSSLPQPQGNTSLPTLEEVGGGMVSSGQYITMSGQQAVTIPVVGSVQGHIPSIGHVVQVSGSTVPLTGVGTALGTGGTSVQAVQAVQTIPGVTTTEYSVQALPPQAVHTAQGYIFTQGFDMVGHYQQYPPGTTLLYSYFESRGGKFPYVCFFGLQYILKRWLTGPVVTKEAVKEAKEVYAGVFLRDDIFNEDGWNHIIEHHGGRLPLRIKAVPEGTVLPTKNVLFTVENTDPAVPWLTNFFETVLVQAWYPMTAATISRVNKQVIHHYHHLTHDDTSLTEFCLHDCGYRGVSSVETAAIGGAAHMINFKSSDTVAGSCLLRKYYHVDTVGGHSGPFSEHSTVTSWGRETEAEAHRNLITSFPGGQVGCVVDSYDLWQCCDEIFGVKLKELVVEHGKKGGQLAIRPDSGDPTVVVLRCLEILGKHFGVETNSKGYKMLPPFLRIVHADGVNYQSVADVLEVLKENGWSAACVGFGAGASLLQRMDRDTLKCAYKCSLAVVGGREVEVYKEPITDPGKTSKKGRLSLHRQDGHYTTAQHGQGDPETDLLVPVFENGELLRDYTFEEIRQRAQITDEDPDILEFLKVCKQ